MMLNHLQNINLFTVEFTINTDDMSVLGISKPQEEGELLLSFITSNIKHMYEVH